MNNNNNIKSININNSTTTNNSLQNSYSQIDTTINFDEFNIQEPTISTKTSNNNNNNFNQSTITTNNISSNKKPDITEITGIKINKEM